MHRVAQFVGHLSARVSPHELQTARRLLPPAAGDLFTAMPVADQRHALDVVRRLLDQGMDDPDLLVAALLHDVAKGRRLRLWHRAGGVLLAAVAPRILVRMGSANPASPGFAWYLFLHHAELSAAAARAAGASERAARFIHHSTEPRATEGVDGPREADVRLAAALHAADEAS